MKEGSARLASKILRKILKGIACSRLSQTLLAQCFGSTSGSCFGRYRSSYKFMINNSWGLKSCSCGAQLNTTYKY